MDVLVLEIDGIDGESTLDGYAGKINCLSFGHGLSNALQTDVSNIGRARGRCEHADFTISKYFDKASPLLAYKSCIGANLGVVKFTVLRAHADAGHSPMIIYSFDNTMVSSVSVGGGEADTPIETIGLNYTKIKWEYKVQGFDMAEPGSVASEWDLTTNVGSSG
ncbi:MAG: type VI secretion system tube protein Hcp [Proteobacteria bacterium]|nr:type VI secretion system tube protein Hcp [Pseudomonadota bacterium]